MAIFVSRTVNDPSANADPVNLFPPFFFAARATVGRVQKLRKEKPAQNQAKSARVPRCRSNVRSWPQSPWSTRASLRREYVMQQREWIKGLSAPPQPDRFKGLMISCETDGYESKPSSKGRSRITTGEKPHSSFPPGMVTQGMLYRWVTDCLFRQEVTRHQPLPPYPKIHRSLCYRRVSSAY